MLKEKAGDLGADKRSSLKIEYTSHTILVGEQRQKLMAVADYIHSTQQLAGNSSSILQDLKIVFPRGAVDQITGTAVETILKDYHSQCNDRLKLVLRRTSPTEGCIPWHVDGGYSRGVVQYTLNDDNLYAGGRLCFFSEDMGLLVPRRPAGTVTVHSKEMHGVSKLLSGVRYVLFVVDESNGLGGETANIVELTSGQLAHMLSPLSKW